MSECFWEGSVQDAGSRSCAAVHSVKCAPGLPLPLASESKVTSRRRPGHLQRAGPVNHRLSLSLQFQSDGCTQTGSCLPPEFTPPEGCWDCSETVSETEEDDGGGWPGESPRFLFVALAPGYRMIAAHLPVKTSL
ncbi:hypothetical protein SKAU_G00044850 [Synaphobranchus kaupii]|uniref:Uncharacterized protein n=1 Tax=Synaphobranchus kaupii TaxID=118154 RepID=A0A9Q1J963_SYNKA|nr:hypothetical protein SKAU_G00044850 [Synaphobranchus kaupii]